MRKSHVLIAALAAIAFGAPALTQAQYHRFESVVSVGVDDDWMEEWQQDDPSLLERTISNPGVGSATASAQMGLGINKVYAHYDATTAFSLIASGETMWADEVTISHPDLNGTVGFFTASLRVTGNASFSMTGGYTTGDASVYGFWDSWIGVSTDGGDSFLVDGWFGDWVTYYDPDTGTSYLDYQGDDLTQPMTEVQLEFIYGQPFILGGRLDAYIDADNSNMAAGSVDATLDFSHSAYWNGISGLYDSNGNLVSGTSLTSASGVNWMNPVPEPTSIAALAIGGLALLRRRTK